VGGLSDLPQMQRLALYFFLLVDLFGEEREQKRGEQQGTVKWLGRIFPDLVIDDAEEVKYEIVGSFSQMAGECGTKRL
jgi:hypothetical protein